MITPYGRMGATAPSAVGSAFQAQATYLTQATSLLGAKEAYDEMIRLARQMSGGQSSIFTPLKATADRLYSEAVTRINKGRSTDQVSGGKTSTLLGGGTKLGGKKKKGASALPAFGPTSARGGDVVPETSVLPTALLPTAADLMPVAAGPGGMMLDASAEDLIEGGGEVPMLAPPAEEPTTLLEKIQAKPLLYGGVAAGAAALLWWVLRRR